MSRRRAGSTTDPGPSDGTRAKAGKAPGRARKESPRRGTGQNGLASPSSLRLELRAFISEHPQGWGHQEWLELLEDLRARGHEIHDEDAVGAMLERQRLIATLNPIGGLGPRRLEALTDRFGSIWRLSRADPQEIAQAARIPRSLAEKIRNRV